MDFKYYQDIPTTTHVWYDLIGIDKGRVDGYENAVCFAHIAHGFHQDADIIRLYHEKRLVPYNPPEIKRWITDLNNVGFPCGFEEQLDPLIASCVSHINNTVNTGLEDMTLMIMRQGEELPPTTHNFFIKVADYKDKNHMFSTLFLIRCLLETGINRVPEEYFKLMDTNPARDKFEAIQIAHKIVTYRDAPYDPKSHASRDHMVTFDGNGENITQSALMSRFAESKTDVRDKGYLRLSINWNGSSDSWKG